MTAGGACHCGRPVKACGECARHYTAHYRRDRIISGRRTVDARPVREHVRRLQAAGYGACNVAEAAGVGVGTIDRLMWGAPWRGEAPSARLDRDKARRLLAVTDCLAVMPDGARVDATSTRAKVALLRANGWTLRALAEATGHDPQVVKARGALVSVRVARQVAWLACHAPHPPEWAWDRRGWARDRDHRRRVYRARKRAQRGA